MPKISEFANTQNKVNAADFFSNHPFHIRIEQFSRSVIFTAREGERHDHGAQGHHRGARGQRAPEAQRRVDPVPADDATADEVIVVVLVERLGQRAIHRGGG